MCCGCIDSEYKETLTIPASEEQVNGLNTGAEVAITLKGKITELSTEYGNRIRIEVETLTIKQGDNTFEALLDED